MNILNRKGIIEKCITIDKFNDYTPSEELVLNTSLCIEEFNSKWRVNVCPMYPTNHQDKSSVYCDVFVTLICEESTSPLNICKQLNISCSIKGRENYPVLFELDKKETQPTWKCAIISHVTLQSLKLIRNNKLEFFLHFEFSDDILNKCLDGRNDLTKHMEDLFKNPQYFDTCLISSSDEKFYVHASVLHSRSNIIKTGKVLSFSKQHECQEKSLQEEDDIINSEFDINFSINKTSFKNDYSESSSSSNTSLRIDKYLSSPAKQPLFTVLSNSKKSKEISSFSSPNKSRKISNSSLTPKKKKSEGFGSPSKKPTQQMQLTHFFPRSSSLNIKNENDVSLQFSPFSPIKGVTPSKYSKAESPRIKNLKENTRTPSKQSPFRPSVNSDIRSPTGVIPLQNSQNLKRKLFDDEVEQDRNLTIIKLNISSSVLLEFLSWIYVGKSHRLNELSRPLLAAAKRHGVNDLFRSTQIYLASTLTVDNVSELLALSYKYEANSLKNEAMQFAVSRASEVTVEPCWRELSLKYPEILLEFSERLAIFKS